MHLQHISAKAYRTLGHIHQIFKLSHPFEIKNKFYLSLLQHIHTSSVWSPPHLITDIKSLSSDVQPNISNQQLLTVIEQT